MRTLHAEQDPLALSILSNCFLENANFQFMFGKKPAEWRRRLFLRTYIRHARHQKGAYISNDEQGIAFVWCNSASERRSPLSFLQALTIFPLRRLMKIKRFQQRVARLLPSEPHLYFQFLAVGQNKNQISTILDLRDNTFRLADSMHLPIYAQTSSERTRGHYERFGFKMYGELTFPNTSNKMYFLKRECSEV